MTEVERQLRLMKAAPDLLEALKTLIDALMWDDEDDIGKALDIAGAAIEKAEPRATQPARDATA